jgi:hypothetical protein
VISSEIRQQRCNAIDGQIFTSHAEGHFPNIGGAPCAILHVSPIHKKHFSMPQSASFGLLKKKLSGALLLDGDDSAAFFIRRVFHSMKKTFMSYNTHNTLARMRFRDIMDGDPYFRIFSKFVLPGSQGFLTLS